jgi:UDP-galactopyranose mutase
MNYDYVIVGSGLTGAVLARSLADAGNRVLVLDRREHLGGNVADKCHPSGIIVHTYGPHTFRTNSDAIWEFVNRFTRFTDYRWMVKSVVNGKLENWPIARSYIERVCGPDWKPAEPRDRPANFEEAALSLMPREIYETFVKKYTEKQWGVPATSLDAKLCKRFNVHHDDSPYLTPTAKHQGIPVEGYSVMMGRMLQGIPLLLNVDYLACREEFRPKQLLVFTGPIDEYFNYELGKLVYRGQQRQVTYHPQTDWVQPCPVINNPTGAPHVRDVEWKHVMPRRYADRIGGAVITRETPFTPTNPDQYEYPFPDDANGALYEKYRKLAKEEAGVMICGRLGGVSLPRHGSRHRASPQAGSSVAGAK